MKKPFISECMKNVFAEEYTLSMKLKENDMTRQNLVQATNLK